MKKLLSLALVAFIGLTTATAQLTQVVVEQVMDKATFDVVSPPGTGYPAGGVTYRVYAELQDPIDFVTSIYAIANCYTMEVLANNTFFNTSFGGATGPALNAGFFGFVPELQWDSMVTIGRASSADPGAAISVAASNPAGYFADASNFVLGLPTGNDMNLIDGSWYALNGDVNGLGTGPNNRVLLGQFTVTQPLSFKMNIQIINDGIGIPSNNLQYVWDDINNLVCSNGVDEIDGSAIGLIYPFVPGCTNVAALNYDSGATADDGSCIVPACAATNESDCYGNDGDDLLITALGADPIIVEFTSTDIEVCCDLFNVYDGSDNTGVLLLGPVNGDLAGTIVVATSGNMYFEYGSDGSFSCDDALQGSTDFDLYCGEIVVPGCTNGFALNFDPAANSDDGSCVLPNCAPVADSYCYADGGDSFIIDADGIDDIVLEITAGTIETTWDSFSIYDGTDNSGTLLYGPAEGDQAGVIAVATSGNMFVEYNSDGTGSCGDAQESLMTFNIYCGTRNLDVLGCTTVGSCNYNPLATSDDGSCIAAVANDNCSGAIALTDGVSVVGDNTNACGTPEVATVPGAASCASAGQEGWCPEETDVEVDVWYSFTTPANDAEVTIQTTAGDIGDTQIALFDGCGGNFLFGNDDNPGGTFYSLLSLACGDLAVSTTYYILVDGYGGAQGTFNIVVNFDENACVADPEGCTDPAACNYDPAAVIDDGSCIAAVANDNCSGAEALTSGVAVTGDNTLACGTPEILVGPAGSGCNAQDGWCQFETVVDNDVWYSFTTPAGDALITIETTAGTNFDTQVAVYGACNDAGSFVGGNDDGGAGNMSLVTFACGSLAASTTYYVMVDGYAGEEGTFDILLTIDEAICSLPVLGCTNPAACNFDPLADTDDGSCILAVANDDCANAIPVATDGVDVVIDNSCATADGATPDCWFGNPTGNDVWYSFVAPAAGSVTIETSDDGVAGLTDTQIAVYDGCAGNELACDDDDGLGLYSLIVLDACDLIAGNTYLIQMNGYNGQAGTANMSITLGDLLGCTIPASLNYNPCATIDDGSCIAGIASALNINPQLFPNCTGVLGTTVLPGETALPEQGPFSGNPDDEAWYSFTTVCDGGVKVLCDAFAADMVIELYDDQLNFLAAGDDNAALGEYVFAQGISAGSLLYARIYTYGTGSTADFNICVSSFCASSPDDPYPSLTYDACDVYKCDNIPGADNYSWSLTPQGGGTELTYTSAGNYTFLNLSLLSGLVEYGVTYDVRIDANFTDGDIGTVTITGLVEDVLVMEAGPSTQLRADYVGNTYDIAASLRCPAACNADSYIWLINPVGGAALAPVTRPGTSTLLPLQSVAGLLPGTDYEVQIAVVYEGVEYPYGALLPFSTAAAPLLEVRAADICGNAGPLPYGYYIRTNVFPAGADDFTWAFTNTNLSEPTIYWRKGDAVRILRLNDVKDGLGNNLLVAGESYNVEVKPEYGTFLSQGNDNTALEPQYDFATSYGATQEVCIVGGAGAAGEGTVATRDTQVSIEVALYPNPSIGDFVNLNLNNIDVTAEKVSVDIYDLFGKLVQSEQIATTGSSNLNVVLNLNKSMASGLYMVNITVGEVVQTERLVIEK